jgi:hypothetical protein
MRISICPSTSEVQAVELSLYEKLCVFVEIVWESRPKIAGIKSTLKIIYANNAANYEEQQ